MDYSFLIAPDFARARVNFMTKIQHLKSKSPQMTTNDIGVIVVRLFDDLNSLTRKNLQGHLTMLLDRIVEMINYWDKQLDEMKAKISSASITNDSSESCENSWKDFDTIQIEELLKRIAHLETSLKTKEDQLERSFKRSEEFESLEAENVELREEIESNKTVMNNMQIQMAKQLAISKKEINGFNALLQERDESLQEVNVLLQQETETTQRLNSEIRELKATCDSLRVELNDREKTIDLLNDQQSQLLKEKQSNQETIAVSHDRIRDLEEIINTLQQEQQSSNKSQAMLAALLQSKSVLETQVKQLRRAAKELATSKENLEAMSREKDAFIGDLVVSRDHLQRENAQLRLELKESREFAEQLDREAKVLQEQVHGLLSKEEQLNTLEEELRVTREDLVHSRSEYETLRDEKDKVLVALESCQRKLAESKELIAALQSSSYTHSRETLPSQETVNARENATTPVSSQSMHESEDSHGTPHRSLQSTTNAFLSFSAAALSKLQRTAPLLSMNIKPDSTPNSGGEGQSSRLAESTSYNSLHECEANASKFAIDYKTSRSGNESDRHTSQVAESPPITL